MNILRINIGGCTLGDLNLKEEAPNLADIFLLIMNFFDNTWIWGGNLGELFIGGNVSQFLELLYLVALFNVEFFNGPLFDFFA